MEGGGGSTSELFMSRWIDDLLGQVKLSNWVCFKNKIIEYILSIELYV